MKKMYASLLALGLVLTSFGQQWEQMGADIDGEAAYDFNGITVSISGDGTTMATGANLHNNDIGHAKVFSWDGTDWVQKGLEIEGEAGSTYSASSVSLNADGSVLAIGSPRNAEVGSLAGHVRVYEWNGVAWVQRGVDIDGEAASDLFGTSVDLSADGNTLIAGGPGNDGIYTSGSAGHVRVFTWDGSSWVQKGLSLNGSQSNDEAGTSVSISADGDRIAFGMPKDGNANGSFSGAARIYDWDGSSWVKLGLDIIGADSFDKLGTSVDLSSDGTSIVVGAPDHDGGGNNASGLTRVYTWNGSSWEKKGSDIIGLNASDNCGFAVSINGNGNIISVGFYDESPRGVVRNYEWSGSAWTQIGGELHGEDWQGSAFGRALELDDSGTRNVIGDPQNKGTGFMSSAGHVQVYESTCPETTSSITITACDSYTVPSGDETYSMNGVYMDTISNSVGCDSVITINLTINNSTTGTDVIAACDAYTWIDGVEYTSSNSTATYTLTNAVGCDSVVTLNLTINNSTTGIDVITACDAYTWIDGIEYTSSNSTATYTLTNAAGCDSVVTLNLTINNSTTGTDVITACDAYTWIDGIEYTSSNSTATYTLTNAAGCDSVVTLNLTINNSTTGTDVITACDAYTWIDGIEYTSSNSTATYTLTNAAGCDSVVTLNLTINNSTTGTDVITACDAYTWIDGIEYTSSNSTATYTLTNAVGCDSVVTLNLTINNSTTGTDVITACNSYTWIDGIEYTSSNSTATYTLTNVAGCDSVVTLNLTINNSTTGTDVITACDAYTWIDGIEYTSSNSTATYTLTNAVGCDSVVTLNLTINNSTTGTDIITACDAYTWIDGIEYTSSNSTATYTLTNAAGCDSVVTLNLTINNSTTGTDIITACDAYTWIDGIEYTSSNSTATYTLTNAVGCDSVVTLNLTINNSTTGTDVITACDAYTWIDGIEYTSSNSTATYTLTNTAGCDSVVTLNLTINNSTTGTDVITACDAYTWIDGIEYTSSNSTATYTLTNVAGCDSVVTLNLTINTVDASVSVTENTIQATTSGADYQWIDCNSNQILSGENGQSFAPDENGSYAVIVDNGCADTSECVVINTIALPENKEHQEIHIYPNPTNDKIVVELGGISSALYAIVDIQGRVIREGEINGKQVLSLADCLPGVYFVRCEFQDKTIVRTIVKE